jgi:hypothetical protein
MPHLYYTFQPRFLQCFAPKKMLFKGGDDDKLKQTGAE